jgi:hypothetical protein
VQEGVADLDGAWGLVDLPFRTAHEANLAQLPRHHRRMRRARTAVREQSGGQFKRCNVAGLGVAANQHHRDPRFVAGKPCCASEGVSEHNAACRSGRCHVLHLLVDALQGSAVLRQLNRFERA